MKSSFAFNGKNSLAYSNKSSITYGKNWNKGDVVGCGIDFDNNRLDYWLNGELLSPNSDEYESQIH
jgi:hypothetical protein